jgi:hypothetical protein
MKPVYDRIHNGEDHHRQKNETSSVVTPRRLLLYFAAGVALLYFWFNLIHPRKQSTQPINDSVDKPVTMSEKKSVA